MRPNSLRKAFMPGTKDPNGWENGYVEPQRTYQNVGSQTPIAHDRDGHPVEVEGKGMMKIPGYEWHDKSPEFHKLAGLTQRIAAKYAASKSGEDLTVGDRAKTSTSRRPVVSDRSSLIRLASSLPKGSPERKALLTRISESKKASPAKNDIAVLLSDIVSMAGLTAIAGRERKDGGAEIAFEDGWKEYSLIMDGFGKYVISVSGKTSGKIPYVPYEDHHDMALELLSEKPLSYLRR